MDADDDAILEPAFEGEGGGGGGGGGYNDDDPYEESLEAFIEADPNELTSSSWGQGDGFALISPRPNQLAAMSMNKKTKTQSGSPQPSPKGRDRRPKGGDPNTPPQYEKPNTAIVSTSVATRLGTPDGGSGGDSKEEEGMEESPLRASRKALPHLAPLRTSTELFGLAVGSPPSTNMSASGAGSFLMSPIAATVSSTNDLFLNMAIFGTRSPRSSMEPQGAQGAHGDEGDQDKEVTAAMRRSAPATPSSADKPLDDKPSPEPVVDPSHPLYKKGFPGRGCI